MELLKLAFITCYHCSACVSEQELTEDTTLWWRPANVTVHKCSTLKIYKVTLGLI